MAESGHRGEIQWGWWLRWGTLGLLLALVIGHAIWGATAAGRLQRQIQALRNAGEPVAPADFTFGSFNAPENAAPDILAAMNLIDWKTPEWKAFDDRMDPIELPLHEEERQVLAAVVPQLSAVLARLDQARGKTRFDWEQPPASPMIDRTLTDLNDVRTLATALSVQAMHDFDAGRHSAAVDRIEQLLFIGRYPDEFPSLVSHLVSLGIEALTMARILEMAPTLRIGAADTDLSPQRVRKLIDQLLDERQIDQGTLRALRGERAMQVDSIMCLLNGTPIGAVGGGRGTAWNPWARYLAKPVLQRNASTMLDEMTRMIAASREKSLPEYRAKYPPPQPSNSILDHLSGILLPSLDRFAETNFRARTDRRLAAAALAVRWYMAEHNGQLPASLEQLVPTYLPAIPLDPLASGDKPIRYLPGAGKPIIWSVGVNGVDDNGSEAAVNPKRVRPPHEWEMLDRVVPLYPRPRPIPTTNQLENSGGQ